MKKTKIDWCDSTVNCVYGCPNNCKYCYGNVLNKRFHFCKNWSIPEWKPEHLKDFTVKKPRSIFIDSMSDIGTWKYEWFEAVMNAIWDNAQHKYIALTKKPSGFIEMNAKYGINSKRFLMNLFAGVTVVNKASLFNYGEELQYFDFLSVEPLLGPIGNMDWLLNQKTSAVKLLIIGAETGNRKGKVIPEKGWVLDLVEQCNEAGTKVFMKESLRSIMGNDFRQDELLWRV